MRCAATRRARAAPDVKINAEPALIRRLYKGAEPVFDGAGNLIPWEPEA